MAPCAKILFCEYVWFWKEPIWTRRFEQCTLCQSPEDEQSTLIETSCSNWFFSEPHILTKENFSTWCHRKYMNQLILLLSPCKPSSLTYIIYIVISWPFCIRCVCKLVNSPANFYKQLKMPKRPVERVADMPSLLMKIFPTGSNRFFLQHCIDFERSGLVCESPHVYCVG